MCSDGCDPCDRIWEPLPVVRRARRWPVGLAGAVGLGFCGISAAVGHWWQPAPFVVWNATASAPIGFWRIRPGHEARRGDMVLARLPRSMTLLAAARGYLPIGVPLLKRVAAMDGDEICARERAVFVNAVRAAIRRVSDARGRSLPDWSGCERLRGGRLLLLTAWPDSFDSRYFGPVDRGAVIGTATPLWVH